MCSSVYSTSSAHACHSCTPSTETHVSQRSASQTYAIGSVRLSGTNGPGCGWYAGVDHDSLGSRTPTVGLGHSVPHSSSSAPPMVCASSPRASYSRWTPSSACATPWLSYCCRHLRLEAPWPGQSNCSPDSCA